MSVKNRTFSSWNRDHHKTFAAAIAAELERKANIDSPNFTGIPTAPTPEQGTKNNQIATTEFVADAVGDTSNTQDAVSKSGDTMNGALTISIPPESGGTVYPLTFTGKFKNDKTSTVYTWRFAMSTVGTTFYVQYAGYSVFCFSPLFFSASNRGATLGFDKGPWANAFLKKLNNGADIEIPSKAGTMALVSDIEDTLRKYNLIPETTNTDEQN